MRSPLWLALGSLLLAPSARAEDDLIAKADAKITVEDRAHWAFQPVRRPEVPKVRDEAWCRTPIDRFVLAKLEEKGWNPAPPPGPLALLRRLHFDLTGLPPTPAEQQSFLRDPSPEALDRVIDDLLARPQYGERRARRWLDLVRFAESNGFERDAAKPNAWKYRDWVIRASNDDMPYDRFLTEQIAGDELPDASASSQIATGFFRLGPWDDEPADPKQDRFDQLDDMVATTSEVFLGLTIACARCHDHKFEPLSSVDYTRLVAVFAPLDRPRNGRTELDLPAGSRAEREALAARDRSISEIQRKIAARMESASKAVLEDAGSPFPADARKALRTRPDARNEDEKRIAGAHQARFDQMVKERLADGDRAAIADLEREIARLRHDVPDLPRGYFLHEPSIDPPLTHLLTRGQASSPGPVVAPGVPAVLVATQPTLLPPEGGTTRRRLTLARWLASPEHPLTARVIVNRVWQGHFGEGIVRTPSDFGTAGDPPTHPELLDWLADWFTHEGGWSIKKLDRLILASNAARMGKLSNPAYSAEDPEDRLLWRMPYRRLEVECLRDAILSATGRLNPTMYGPSFFPAVPRGALEGNSDPDKIWKATEGREAERRTIYAFVKRSMVVPMLEVLDFCDTTRSAAKRQITNTAPQALALFNGDFVAEQSAHLADRLMREAGDDPAKQIDLAYRLALGRPATADEVSALADYLDREAKAIRETTPTAPAEASRRALARMGRLIFNLNEFAFTD